MEGYEVPQKLQEERQTLEKAIPALRRTLKAAKVGKRGDLDAVDENERYNPYSTLRVICVCSLLVPLYWHGFFWMAVACL